MNGHKVFLSLLTMLVTIAMGLGAFALERINHLYEIKASLREVEQMRQNMKDMRLELKMEIKEMRADLIDIKVALGVPPRSSRSYRNGHK